MGFSRPPRSTLLRPHTHALTSPQLGRRVAVVWLPHPLLPPTRKPNAAHPLLPPLCRLPRLQAALGVKEDALQREKDEQRRAMSLSAQLLMTETRLSEVLKAREVDPSPMQVRLPMHSPCAAWACACMCSYTCACAHVCASLRSRAGGRACVRVCICASSHRGRPCLIYGL
jgi:hypothetical protein